MSVTPIGQTGHRLGSVLRIDDRTVMVRGQELSLTHDQPDVANAILHRVDQTLFMIDTGATTAFRSALNAAVDLVGSWRRLIVLNTHGHPDHVGNNDLADELAAERDVTAQVWVAAADLAQLRDPQRYWITSFGRLPGLAPLPVAPTLAACKITSLFEPFRAFSQHLRCFEQSTGEVIELGPHRLVGWTFADGAVSVLPSQGHCAGHVVVYLRDSKVLHLGDEANGPCPVMHDADQHKLTEIQTVARDLLEAGLVDHLSDGHSAAVDDAAQAQARISRLLQQSLDLQDTAAHLSAGSASVDAADFVAGLAQRYDDLHVVSANANPVFVGMMAAEQLQRLGYRRRPYGTRWISRPRSAGATSSLTVLRVLRGLAATVPWRLRGLHRQATNNGS